MRILKDGIAYLAIDELTDEASLEAFERELPDILKPRALSWTRRPGQYRPVAGAQPAWRPPRICPKRDSYPDGREFTGVGIKPGITMVPGAGDIRRGRDPVLERAVAELAAAAGGTR